MTRAELAEIEKGYSESKLQHICVTWFRTTFPGIGRLLFSVPNGGWRGGRAGSQMVYEGQVKGVADLVLLYPSGGKATLCIEMKVPPKKGSRAGRQSEEQKEWQELVERYGSRYSVCHGLVEFIETVTGYLKLDTQKHIINALRKYPLYR